jgi:protoheme IX farnesyltransferase
MLKHYYSLTKPGMIRGNAIITVAGFLLASKGDINIWLLIATLAGISCVIGSGCVFNNYIDRKIDKKMPRTEGRALVTGKISGKNALFFASILGIIGFVILLLYTNILATIVALVGFVVYVGIYSPLKHSSVHAALIGSIAGAVPPVVGYVAVTNHLDPAALILFLILIFWQMPHFYSISIYRYDDYAAADIPVLSVKKGIARTKIHIIMYIILFIITSYLLTAFHYTGFTYALVAGILGLAWLALGLSRFQKKY